MRKLIVLQATLLILFCGAASSFGQTVSDEAKRHFDRGMAAVETAKSPDDYAPAIKEFEQAASLAPDWPDVYYNLGIVQEKAEKYSDAIISLQQYLRLAPNASDAETVKALINKLEYKKEQVLSIPDIIDVLVSFGSWKQEGRLCQRWGEYAFAREGTDAVRVLKSESYSPERFDLQTLKVAGPVLKYITTVNVCGNSVDEQGRSCDSVMEHEVEVVSKSLVKVNQKVLRGGIGNGLATGDSFSCTFQKNP